MEYNLITYDVSNRIATIKLNRPRKLNAFSKEMAKEIITALSIADKDDEVRVVIITGNGKTFCAGGDLSVEPGKEDWYSGIVENLFEDQRNLAGMVTLTIYNSKKPIIAAINGAAMGVGITMTLAADIRIASRNAKFGFLFSRRGLVNEAISSWFLPRIVGLGKAMEWSITGRIIEIEEALKYGLVNEACAPEDLLPRAYEIATEIVKTTSAISVALCRQLILKNQRLQGPEEAYKIESEVLLWAFKQADAREGIESFIQKRPPDFKMRPGSDMPDFYPWWE